MDARALGSLTVLAADGRPVRLGTLWADRPAVIVWTRHFGCLFCREQALEFRAALPAITAAGARLVLIGNGGLKHLQDFKRNHAPDVDVYTDSAVATYTAIGARRGVFRTLRPAVWRAGVRALRSGARQTRTQGRPFQQGGVLVVLPGNRIAFTHLSRSAGDHPPVATVLSAIPAAHAAAS